MSETTESEVLRTPLAQEKLYQVNLGSGAFSMPGYVRVDIDPSQKPDLVMDIRKLDFKDASVDVIYASHVLSISAMNPPLRRAGSILSKF